MTPIKRTASGGEVWGERGWAGRQRRVLADAARRRLVPAQRPVLGLARLRRGDDGWCRKPGAIPRASPQRVRLVKEKLQNRPRSARLLAPPRVRARLRFPRQKEKSRGGRDPEIPRLTDTKLLSGANAPASGSGRGSIRGEAGALTWEPGRRSGRRWGKWPQTQTEAEKAAPAPLVAGSRSPARGRLSPGYVTSHESPPPAATKPLRR